jgi:hypothetical protein
MSDADGPDEAVLQVGSSGRFRGIYHAHWEWSRFELPAASRWRRSVLCELLSEEVPWPAPIRGAGDHPEQGAEPGRSRDRTPGPAGGCALVDGHAALGGGCQPAGRQPGRGVVGASWATRMRSATLYRVLAVLLVLVAVALVGTHFGTVKQVATSAIPILADRRCSVGWWHVRCRGRGCGCGGGLLAAGVVWGGEGGGDGCGCGKGEDGGDLVSTAPRDQANQLVELSGPSLTTGLLSGRGSGQPDCNASVGGSRAARTAG